MDESKVGNNINSKNVFKTKYYSIIPSESVLNEVFLRVTDTIMF